MLAEPILEWTQNFMLDNKIINSIIYQFFKSSVNVREERNRSILYRVKFITIFIDRNYLSRISLIVTNRIN